MVTTDDPRRTLLHIGPTGRRSRSRTRTRTVIELGPASTYEALTRQMVEQMADDVNEIKGRLNGLLFLVAGAVILDMLARLMT